MRTLNERIVEGDIFYGKVYKTCIFVKIVSLTKLRAFCRCLCVVRIDGMVYPYPKFVMGEKIWRCVKRNDEEGELYLTHYGIDMYKYNYKELFSLVDKYPPYDILIVLVLCLKGIPNQSINKCLKYVMEEYKNSILDNEQFFNKIKC